MKCFRSYTALKVVGLTIFFLFLAMTIGIGPGVAMEDLIVEEIVIKDGFMPLEVDFVGKFALVKGSVVVIHGGESVGYNADFDLPVFGGDVIITEADSETVLHMTDGSIITLVANTQVELDRYLIDFDQQKRDVSVGLLSGKARFMVEKLKGFKHAEFDVKTPTATCGVRGSHFMVAVAEDGTTTVITYVDTILTIVSMDAQGNIIEEIRMTDYQQAIIPPNARPSLTDIPEEIRKTLEEDFQIDLDRMVLDNGDISCDQCYSRDAAGKCRPDNTRSCDLGPCFKNERCINGHCIGVRVMSPENPICP